jgi:hypothetical protein
MPLTDGLNSVAVTEFITVLYPTKETAIVLVYLAGRGDCTGS